MPSFYYDERYGACGGGTQLAVINALDLVACPCTD